MAVVIGGLLAFNALLAPFGVALGLAILAVGIWTVRNTSATAHEVAHVRDAVSVG